ncbi:MAG: polysaccharide pyruvyl transferase family protein [Oscillospiraceae bacterium]|nr:polysaccharide pyruvyl transferase family protein [Oscillospiraceae bacterium]
MTKIPKIIHYCWVGDKPKPQSVLYCIESWKRYCPDYEIREWNETNYDFTKNEYMRQAYEAKKWGFVPDYARLDIVYEHGGIYLDTDVEMVRSFDELLDNRNFFGFELTDCDDQFYVNCGHGFGAEAKDKTIKRLRDFYDTVSFINLDGSLNILPSPHYTTQVLRRMGLRSENTDQRFPEFTVYASDVLCPKNFRTGRLTKTARTVSIHHFTASWVDDKIKQEIAHQKNIKQRFGGRLGGCILLAESVAQKYSAMDMVTKLPARLMKRTKKKMIEVKDAFPYYWGIAQARVAWPGGDKAVLLDTGMDSDNCGDHIIMECCLLQLRNCVQTSAMGHIPTHRLANKEELAQLRSSGRKILCGTNILSGRMRSYGLWQLGTQVTPYCGTLLMGVGFDSKEERYDLYTKLLLRTILTKRGIHSVRDSFSEKKLKAMGINNVLNTGCPTMWNLTPEHCAAIPSQKARNVVSTVTDYNQDPQNDAAMLDILLENYETVYLWLQGREDLGYIRELGYGDKLVLIPGTLADYDAILAQEDLDYVGTRLHAGIRALSKGHRSLVVSIDNRAECISADTALPLIRRENIPATLGDRVNEEFETRIHMPWETIEKWKRQFK